LHLLIAANFMPRITAVIFRYVLWNQDGHLAFTLAAGLQWYTQIVQIRKSKSSKPLLISSNITCFIAACVLTVIGRILPKGYDSNLLHALNIPVLIIVAVFGWRRAKKAEGEFSQKIELPVGAMERVEKESVKLTSPLRSSVTTKLD